MYWWVSDVSIKFPVYFLFNLIPVPVLNTLAVLTATLTVGEYKNTDKNNNQN